MRATRFEFEHRLWIIIAIYVAGFALGEIDHTSVIVGLRHLITPSLAPGSAQSVMFGRAVIGFGALLVFLTAMLRTWGAAYLLTDVVHDTGQHSETLVADGPFRYTRNPLYFANLTMAAGIGVMASRLGWVFLVAANWFFVYRLILREEEALRQSQGESYRAYCQAVPRFWPSLTPHVPSGGKAAQWAQAFVGESFVWMFGIGELCLALTFNSRLMAAVFVLAFAGHFVVRRRILNKAECRQNVA